MQTAKRPPYGSSRTTGRALILYGVQKKNAGFSLQLGACGDQSLAVLGALVLSEVLHEAAGQILCLLFPLSGICVGVAGIEDGGVNTGQSGGNLKVEVGDLLGGSLVDGTAQDGVDDAAGILDGDALAGAVPAGVDQVSPVSYTHLTLPTTPYV